MIIKRNDKHPEVQEAPTIRVPKVESNELLDTLKYPPVGKKISSFSKRWDFNIFGRSIVIIFAKEKIFKKAKIFELVEPCMADIQNNWACSLREKAEKNKQESIDAYNKEVSESLERMKHNPRIPKT
jgi:hypothetical protein